MSESHPECSNKIEVSNLRPRETTNLIYLSAKDKRSGSVLTSTVKVKRIHRIEIFSRFRQIARGDRAQLEVKAYDDEGNVFSTVEGF